MSAKVRDMMKFQIEKKKIRKPKMGIAAKPTSCFSQTEGYSYLEGQEDLVNRITRVTKWVIGVIDLLTKSP